MRKYKPNIKEKERKMKKIFTIVVFIFLFPLSYLEGGNPFFVQGDQERGVLKTQKKINM